MTLKNRKVFLLKPAAVMVAAGLAAYAGANTGGNNPPQPATLQGPFSQVPLHLQESVTSSGSNVKPNVVLQIDNSGSMGAAVYRGQPSRMEITRQALLRLLRNTKYRDRVNWHMTTLYENGKPQLWSNYAREFLQGRAPFGRNPDDLEQMIANPSVLKPENWTPSTERYLDSIYLLQKALERSDTQACQKSYAILFSDGNQNGWKLKLDKVRIGSGESDDNIAFRLSNTQNNFLPKRAGDVDDPVVFFAHQDPFSYRHPNMATFRITSNSVETDPLNFLSYSERGIVSWAVDNKGWNLADYSSKYGEAIKDLDHPYIKDKTGYTKDQHGYVRDAKGNYVGDWTKAYLWNNRGNSLRYFAETVFHNDLAPRLDGKQNIETYTIAFGLNPNDADDVAAHKYLSGGSTATQGQVLNASNADELDAAFSKIFDDIAAKSRFEPPAAYASLAPAISREETTKKVPNMAAAVHLDLQSGSSELRFYNVAGDKYAFSVDKNAYKRPSFGNRKFMIHDGQNVSWLDSFSAGSNAYFDIPEKRVNGSVVNANEWRTALIPWLMRKGTDGALNNDHNALKYRERTLDNQSDKRNMGDVVGTPILAYGPTLHGRQKYLLTAANDGMVYVFGSSSDVQHPYDLKLNYMPAGMQRESAEDTVAKHYKNIVHPDYVVDAVQYPHRYMVNGGFTVRTMDNSGPEQIFMAGNMGQGGRGTYALNIGGPSRTNPAQNVGIDADPSAWLNTVPLFETPKTNNTMGYTIGAPQIGRLALTRSVDAATGRMTVDRKDVRYGVFVGSGVRNPQAYAPNNDNTESALYVFNALSGVNVGINPSPNSHTSGTHNRPAGELIKKLSVPAGGRGGLAQPAIIDIDFDGSVDVAYAGDFSGGMYRFDLRGGVNDWKVSKIFQTESGQPITAAPAVFREEQNKYIVIFGTGSDLYQEDLNNKSVQAVYGIYDDLTQSTPAPKAIGELQQQMVNESVQVVNGKSYNVRTLTDNPVGDKKGWFFRLPASGERVVVKPDMLLKTALFTTRLYKEETRGNPQTSVCSASESQYRRTSGESWIMQVKADNGGNLPGKGGDDIYAYADFLKQAADRTGKTRPDQLFSGFRNGSGIFNMTLMLGSDDPNQVGGYDNSTSLDGDIRNSGKDSPMSDNPEKNAALIRHCFATDDNKVLGIDTNNGHGVNNESARIYGKDCQVGGIRRLSWRELF